MSEPVLRVNPAQVSTTLKEAVVDALLNMTHAHVSGAGEFGEYLYGARPRTLLNSGFLLPEKADSGGDEVTSPIWISSHGLEMQVISATSAEVTVKPQLSVYVRVLPDENDLSRPNCRLSFRLRRDIFDALRTEVRSRRDQEWEKVKGAHQSRYKHPEWNRIQEEIRKEVYTARGIPHNLALLESEEPTASDEEAAVAGIVVDGATPVSIKDEHFEPLAVPHKWLRLDVTLPEFSFDPSKGSEAVMVAAGKHAEVMNTALQQRLKEWADSPVGKQWGYRSQLTVRPSQYKKWDTFLEYARNSTAPIVLPSISLSWHVQVAQDWLDQTGLNVLVALENKSKELTQHVDEADPTVFLVELEVALPIALHRNLKLERVEPSYRYNRYLQYPAMGHNGGVKTIASPEGQVSIRTTWAPRYTQPRIVPASSIAINRHVRALSMPSGFSGVTPIVKEMKEWLEAQPSRVNSADGIDTADTAAIEREAEKFKDDLHKWGNEISSIEAGIKILEESRTAWEARGVQADGKAVVFEAWLAMNESMANFMQSRFGSDDGKWRLFQLAFIVANIPTLASRIPEFKHYYDSARDDSVTLLYFATGGGKSEAFFGLLVFNLLLDRLRGKLTGVTAMLRYPLRLLTIQQAQRCSKVLAQAELVRRKYGYPGDPFAIGFWVGSGGSPNSHATRGVTSIKEVNEVSPDLKSEMTLRDADQKYASTVQAWNKIPFCPFCGAPTALRRFPKQGGTIAHVCSSDSCPSNEGGWTPLPFYICDEDIYDFAPSVLLGTVDKLALIGHSSGTIRRVFGMLGAAPWQHPATKRLAIPKAEQLEKGPAAAGFDVLYPAYAEGIKHFFDPFPSLLIQDEAHLLDESLGTFAGLFESTLDAVFVQMSRSLSAIIAKDPEGRRRRAKVIAASATVSEPERQLEHLYQRAIPASQFPHPGPSLYDSFYAMPAEPDCAEKERSALSDPEVRAPQARIYCGFMTNGKPHTATSVAILSNFHLCISRLFDALVNGDKNSQEGIRKSLQAYISSGPLQELHRQVLASASVSELATIVDLHRIALTYVTNKKGGDQIMAAELEDTRKRHLNAAVPLETLDTRLITGSVDQGEVQDVVRRAQDRDPPGEPFTPLGNVLRSVIATSAISHGVDVEEFNSMFFAGMPSDIAEYIQASSRVGRTHIGFVVLIPTPQRRRDRYIVEVFDIFHRFLERMVQPAAIDRWAEKAVERVYPSLFQAYLVGVVPSRKLIELPENEKNAVPDYTWIPRITKEYHMRGNAFVEDINRFIELAIGLKDGYCPEGEAHYRKMIDEKTRWFLSHWDSSAMYGNGPLKAYFDGQTDAMSKPMTSLRDVDQGGEIRMSSRDARGRRQKGEEVSAVMSLIRNGVAENEGGA